MSDYNEIILKVMTSLNVPKEHAEQLVAEAMRDPELFKRRQELIERLREQQKKDVKVKGIQLRQNSAPVGRNAPCPCGSGKKFKKCCFKPRTMGAVVHWEPNKDES